MDLSFRQTVVAKNIMVVILSGHERPALIGHRLEEELMLEKLRGKPDLRDDLPVFDDFHYLVNHRTGGSGGILREQWN